MKIKVCILLVFIVLVNSQTVVQSETEAAKDAYFTKVDYPRFKVYQATRHAWTFQVKLTVYNANCSVDDVGTARFFLKIYENGGLVLNEYNDTTYKTWKCDKGSTKLLGRQADIPTWNDPKRCNFKIELYWNHDKEFYLQDTTLFTVDIVLFVDQNNLNLLFSYSAFYISLTVLLILHLMTTGPLEIPSEE